MSSKQKLFGFGNNAFDDFGGRWNIMDQPDGFAGNDSGDIKISGGFCNRVFGGNHAQLLQQFDLAAYPAPRVIVDQTAAGEGRGPDIVAR